MRYANEVGCPLGMTAEEFAEIITTMDGAAVKYGMEKRSDGNPGPDSL